MKKMTWIKGIKIKKIKPSQGMSETRFQPEPTQDFIEVNRHRHGHGFIGATKYDKRLGRKIGEKDWGESKGKVDR
jgi:hypothetical protein